MTPFDLFRQDTEEVIMLINYYIEKGDDTEPTPQHNSSGKNEVRIKVNDKTATNGWF